MWLRRSEVAKRLGVGPTTLWKLVKEGAIPAPRKLGAKIAVWNADELDAAVAALPMTRTKEPTMLAKAREARHGN